MISTPDIELATLADAEVIAALSRDEIEHGMRWGWTARRVRRAIEHRATNVVVARTGGTLVGFALMEYRDTDAHLLLLAVPPAHRRKGIATALVQWLEETARVAGAVAIQVEARATNASGLAFYARLGYEQVNATTGYYQGVETALHLVKEISLGVG